MTETATELELHTGEGVDLAPGSDWGELTREILGPDFISKDVLSKEQYAAVGACVGCMVVTETGITDRDIARTISRRFTEDIESKLHVNHMDTESRVLDIARDYGITIGKMMIKGENNV